MDYLYFNVFVLNQADHFKIVKLFGDFDDCYVFVLSVFKGVNVVSFVCVGFIFLRSTPTFCSSNFSVHIELSIIFVITNQLVMYYVCTSVHTYAHALHKIKRSI